MSSYDYDYGYELKAFSKSGCLNLGTPEHLRDDDTTGQNPILLLWQLYGNTYGCYLRRAIHTLVSISYYNSMVLVCAIRKLGEQVQDP